MNLHRIFILKLLRWITSVLFFYLAMNKTLLLYKFGLQPYKIIITAAGLPGVFIYYGVVAVGVEFYLAAGLWVRELYKSAILGGGVLSLCGALLSVYFIIYKLNTDCGCGLLGDSEYMLLVQKVLITLVLLVLYKNVVLVFGDKTQLNTIK